MIRVLWISIVVMFVVGCVPKERGVPFVLEKPTKAQPVAKDLLEHKEKEPPSTSNTVGVVEAEGRTQGRTASRRQ